jgi:multidrug resistance efflux pump
MGRRAVVVMFIFVFAGIGMAGLFLAKDRGEDEIETAIVKKGSLIVSIKESGVLKAKHCSLLNAPRGRGWWGGIKITKLAPEGGSVKKDDPVVWFDTTQIEKELKDIEFGMKTSRTNLEKSLEALKLRRKSHTLSLREARANFHLAKLELQRLEGSLQRTERLVKAKLIPSKNLEEARNEYFRARLKLEEREATYRKVEEEESSAERLEEIDIELTGKRFGWQEKRYEELKKSMEISVGYAPADGIVIYQRKWSGGRAPKIKEGDQVHAGHPIVSIPDLREMLVISQVDETEISRVKLGQNARIKVDAFPGLELNGRINLIGALAIYRTQAEGAGSVSEEESSGFKVFELTIQVENPDPRLRPGMTCGIDIIIEELKDALYIPVDAVLAKGSKKRVTVLKDSREEEREILLGGQNDENVVVLEGLSIGEMVKLPEKK